jgi:hypothetical protein
MDITCALLPANASTVEHDSTRGTAAPALPARVDLPIMHGCSYATILPGRSRKLNDSAERC